MVDFAGAKISGGTVNFGYAGFSGGPVNFSSAKFSGAAVHFFHSKFTGESPEFTGAGTSGGTVFFHATEFSGGTVSFSNAEFSSGTVDFSRVASWTQPPDFGSGFDMSHPPAGVMLPTAILRTGLPAGTPQEALDYRPARSTASGGPATNQSHDPDPSPDELTGSATNLSSPGRHSYEQREGPPGFEGPSPAVLIDSRHEQDAVLTWLLPAEAVEFSVSYASEKSVPFVGCESEHRPLGVPAVADANLTFG